MPSYEAPAIETLGTLAELTLGINGDKTDGVCLTSRATGGVNCPSA